MICPYLKYSCNGAVVVCRNATRQLTKDEKRDICPNNDNPYIISPFCWNSHKV